ncbi:nuclear pore complex subunit Nro1-domain-containing protein [Umbelopsis sp. PMI_123]|nr:nuclear pore complex subunit Nro1-domain-containing protein [Umbelopsis sp. PMI_123]
MAPAEKKRPRGLKGVAAQKAAKKAKTEEEEDKTQTVILNKEVEEGDELGEVTALYESAKEKSSMGESTDVVLPLLRGTIHECDRILRNWESKEQIPATFHLTYGSALFDLGTMLNDKDLDSYLEAAKERLEIGFDQLKDIETLDESDKKTEAKLRIAMAKLILSNARASPADADGNGKEVHSSILQGLDRLKQAVASDLLLKDEVLEVINIAQTNADFQDVLENLQPLNDWAKEQYTTILQDDEDNVVALSGMGNCHLTVANYWLGKADTEDEDESDTKTELKEEETKAAEQLRKGIDYYKRVLSVPEIDLEVKGDNTINLGEALINLANVTIDEEEQQKIYQEAVTLLSEFKEQTGVELPEGLDNFVEEWNSQ